MSNAQAAKVMVDRATDRPFVVTGGNDTDPFFLARQGEGGGSSADLAAAGIFVPPTDDYAGIMAARAAAIAAGGGVVQLKAIEYDLTAAPAAIPLTSGVIFKGAGFTYGTSRVLVGGTILRGGTTYNVFEWNPVDAGSQIANSATMYAQSAYSIGVSDLAIDGGLNCIRVGGLYSAGAFYADFSNLHLENPVEWCGFFENVSYSSFVRIFTTCIASGRGHLWFAGSMGAVYNHGNNEYRDFFCEGGGALTRNIVFQARGGSSNFNDLSAWNIQCNAQGQTLTTAATMTNGSPNITVADATAFPVDMPVTFATSANGFSAGQTYFVISSSGTTIQLSDLMGSTAINATGSTAINIVRHGFPCVEVVGYGNTNVNTIQPSTFYGMDTEGVATACFAAQNAQIVLGFNFAFGAGAGVASTLLARNCFGNFTSAVGLSTDFDVTSAQRFLSMGAVIRTNNSVNNRVQGWFGDATNNISGLMLANGNDGVTFSLRGINTSGRSFLYPLHAMGQRQLPVATTSLALFGQQMGTSTYIGTTNATWTLPTLTGTVSPTANNYLGSVWTIANCSTTAGVTLTLNTAAGQGFNKTGDTSLVLKPGQSVTVHASTDGTGQFWTVLGSTEGVGYTPIGASLGTTGTVDLDLNALNGSLQTIAATGNLTFTTSNRLAGRAFELEIVAGASPRTLTWPAWTVFGAALPTTLAAGKTLSVTLFCRGTTEASIKAVAVESV